ncbi:MAG: TlpA family protein disulfide reductase [Limisphaerales bacterium]
MIRILATILLALVAVGCKPERDKVFSTIVGPRTELPQEVEQADGTSMRLEAVTFGKKHKFESRHHTTSRPTMILWIRHDGAVNFERSKDSVQVVCLDSEGQECGLGWQANYSFRGGHPHSPSVGRWEFPVYPRDQEEFTVRIREKAAGSTNLRYQASFAIRQKPTPATLTWKPVTLPATNQLGDFEFVLHDLTVGKWPPSFLYRGSYSAGSGGITWHPGNGFEHSWTHATYSLTRKGEPFYINDIESIQDPTGNRLEEWLHVETGRSLRHRYVFGTLPLDQEAWKIAFHRPYDEDIADGKPLTISGIRMPASESAYSTNLVATSNDIEVEFQGAASPGGKLQESSHSSSGYRLAVRVTVPEKIVDVKVDEVTDQDGKVLESPFRGSSWSTRGSGPFIYQRTMRMQEWPSGANHLNITFKPIWKRKALFEFVVKPPEKFRGLEPFDATRLRGEFTAVIKLQQAGGARVGGQPYVITHNDENHGPQTVAKGTMPDDGPLRLPNLAGGKRSVEFTLNSDGTKLGTFELVYDKKEQEFTFQLPPQAGELAPSLPFISLRDAKDTSLARYRGQFVFVDFWTTWCGPCQAPMSKNNEILTRRAKDWEGKAAIISVSLDDGMEKVEKHVQRKRWNQIPHYWMQDGWKSEDAKRFAISGVPTCLLIDPKGEIIWRGHPSRIDIEQKLDDLIAAGQ